MFFIKANPNQFLLSGRNGRIVNRGLAASSFKWPGLSFLRVPSTQQEATFQMTQESVDGIPLRFKGVIIYRIVRPVAAARLFDFSSDLGLEKLHQMLSHLCLGELRACVAGMTMRRCVEERKTTLTQALRSVLAQTVELTDEGDWGLQIEVVQVAQVFVTNPELRMQLEAEARDEIRTKSELSALRADGQLTLARAEAKRVALEQSLVLSRQKARVDQEEQEFALQLRQKKAEHEHRLREEALARETPLKLQEMEAQMELAQEAAKLAEAQGRAEEQKAEYEFRIAKKKQELEMNLLRLEQGPQIAQALSGMLGSAQLNFWGEEPSLLGPMTSIIKALSEVVSLTGESGASERTV